MIQSLSSDSYLSQLIDMQKIKSGFSLFLANNIKDTNPISMAVFHLLCAMIANFAATLQDLYSCSCFLVQSLSNFFITAWNYKYHWTNAAASSSVSAVPAAAAASESGTTLLMEDQDIELVMKNLGIPWDSTSGSGDGVDDDQGRMVLGSSGTEISNLFDECEPNLEEIKEAFDLFDSDKDGYIEAKDLKKILCGLGFVEFSERECEKMIMALNTNSNIGYSGIDFGNFVKIIEGSIC